VQELSKVGDKESVFPMPKSSLERTAHDQLTRTQWTHAKNNVSHAEPRHSQPVQQRSETTTAGIESMLTCLRFL